MENTTNYGLKKPESTEFYDVSVQNANMDVIDTELKKLEAHTTGKSNPHGVTKAQVGLGDVPNVTTNNQTPTYTEATALSELTSGEKLAEAFGKIAKAVKEFISHLANKNNPHSVTKAQIGLGNVDNTSDKNKPISTATQTALDTLSTELATVKKYASDGKLAIASAITGQGVPTNADATFATMSSNIGTVATNKYNSGYTAGNSDDMAKLYQALQYSGFVTDDMTFDEMCEVLAEEYPSAFVLYKNGVNNANFTSYKGSAGGGQYANTDEGYANLSITYGNDINAVYSNMNGNSHVSSIMSKLIDLTNYKELKFTFNSTGANNDTAIRDISVFIADNLTTDMTATAKYTILSANAQTSNSGEGVIDISNLSGNYYIGINLIARYNVNLTIGNMVLR